MAEQDDKQRELKRLITQMREGSNEDARKGMEELRSRGWLTNGSLAGAYLRRIKFRNINLEWANLENVNMRKVDLRQSDLSYANLRSADLSGVDLREATLSPAHLQNINLSEAKLR